MRLDRRVVRWLVAVVVALAAVVGLSMASAAFAPTTVASAGELDAQRGAAERAIQRVYAAGLDQLKTTRSLKLAITDAQAAAIEQKYADQLKALRRSALQAVGDAYGQTADQSAQYAAQAEPRLDGTPAASSAPVLLAPRLYAIVERMGQLTSQLTDQGIREMTQAQPSGSPAASPSAAPSRTPRPTTSPSASPTGR
ncbi:MAG TPA: hypothetical protein VFC31_09240 [Candidatus Limnocylindria bacterium]|nr:hypothetical protein [Candidatus Limnocylindria bacterium]